MTKEFKLSEKIRKELEKGIKRNDVLPLDYAMDRIEPILKEFIRRLKEDLDFRIGHPDNKGQASKELIEIKERIDTLAGDDLI